ncbi:DUF305 domain-containing protein [Streptomyces sp. NPDC012935]|uniref:DUF305 domain-containing protein n=1 Tax=Streptomyces sp. NPDC012935 TaxID=3364857 RepID=UPI0036A1FA58
MTSTRTVVRRAALAATAVTAALVLSACAGGDHSDTASGAHPSPSPSADATAGATAGAHNAQDVSFAQGMIPHHRQAVEMAALAADRASSARVKDLATRVEKAQAPEIRTMSGWLKAWGEDVPSAAPAADDTDGMDHSGGHGGDTGMAGMMDRKDMDRLAKSSGKAFDSMFLTMMVEHHEGAVEMAEAEKAKGKYAPATALADDVISAQTAEIEEMNKLLGKNEG